MDNIEKKRILKKLPFTVFRKFEKGMQISEIVLVTGDVIRDGANNKITIIDIGLFDEDKTGWISLRRNKYIGTMGGCYPSKSYLLNIENIASISLDDNNSDGEKK